MPTILIGARIGGHGAKCAFAPTYETEIAVTAVSPQFVLLPLLAFAKALRDRRSPEDQRGLVREALREVGVIVLHDVEHGFLGKPSMVIGKEFVQVSELFVVHGFRASAAIPQIYRKLLIPCQLLARLVTFREPIWMVIMADIGGPKPAR